MRSVNKSWHMAARCNDDYGQRLDKWQQASAGLTLACSRRPQAGAADAERWAAPPPGGDGRDWGFVSTLCRLPTVSGWIAQFNRRGP
jgi:hypothetical protein